MVLLIAKSLTTSSQATRILFSFISWISMQETRRSMSVISKCSKMPSKNWICHSPLRASKIWATANSSTTWSAFNSFLITVKSKSIQRTVQGHLRFTMDILKGKMHFWNNFNKKTCIWTLKILVIQLNYLFLMKSRCNLWRLIWFQQGKLAVVGFQKLEMHQI